MRLNNSIRNVAASVMGQSLAIIINFATRMVFVRTLSKEYLGIEGLFSSILMVLSLTELGIGSAIVYSLYKPLAEGDQAKVRALMGLYRRAYLSIGLIVAILGTLISFKLSWFMNKVPDIPNLQLIFLCFVLNSALSYFFSYKGSLITADQKNYIVLINRYVFSIFMCLFQITALLVFHSYWAFIGIMIFSTLLQNISISVISNRLYPYQNEKPVGSVDAETMAEIKKNTFALVIHSFAGVSSTPIANMILSSFVGIGIVAVYANYLLITAGFQRFVSQIFDAIMASVGNLGVTESNEKKHKIFMVCLYINAFLAIIFSVPLVAIFSGSVKLLFGQTYVLPFYLEILIVVLAFAKNLRSAGLSFTGAFGLYWFTRYKALAEAVILIILSLLLVQYFGLGGILSANIFTCIFISAVIEGYMLYKHGFKISSRGYFLRWAYYLGVLAILSAVAFGICFVIEPHLENLFLRILLQGIISLAISVAGFFALTFWLPEFQDFCPIIANSYASVSKKLGFRKAKTNE